MIWKHACVNLLLVICSSLLAVSAKIFSTKYATVQGIYNDSATIVFTKNSTAYPNITIKSFDVTLPPSEAKIATQLNNRMIIDTNPFGSRLTAAVDGDGYNLTVSDLLYTDEYVIQGELVYENLTLPGPNNLFSLKEYVQLVVKGGPTLCGPELPSIVLFDLSRPSFVNLTFCGNEKPLLKWTIDDKELTVASLYNSSNKYEYIYNVSISQGDPSICGKQFSYLATGYGNDISGSSTIDVRFKPVVVITEARVTDDKKCLRITWNQIDIGNCTGLKYVVQLLNGFDLLMNVSVANETATSYSLCEKDLANINEITKVQLKAEFKSDIGEWSEKLVVIPTAPTTPTITTITTTMVGPSSSNELKNNDDDKKKIYIIVGAVIGGSVFIILFILVLVCCCRKKKKNRKMVDGGVMDSMDEFDCKNVSELPNHQNEEEKFKIAPPSTIIHPSKIIHNKYEKPPKKEEYAVVKSSKANKEENKTNEEDTTIDVQPTETQKVLNETKTVPNEAKINNNGKNDEVFEVVAAAQLKYYDPTNQSKGKSDELKGENKDQDHRPTEFNNQGYGRDEYDSDDDDNDYENYHKNFKADQLPAEAYQDCNLNLESNL